MMDKIMVVAAHPDDEVLGAGGVIKKYSNSGKEIIAVILGEGQTSRYNKRKDVPSNVIGELHNNTFLSADVLGYKKIYFADFPDNRFDDVNLLDIVKFIEKIKEEFKPDIIYTHHGGDLNIDHKLTFQAVVTATRPITGVHIVNEIYAFETLSSTEWDFSYNIPFRPNVFVDITDTVKDKIKAMEYYKSELCKFPHPRSIEILKTSAMKWGSVIGCKYAEAFELIRKIG